MVTAVVDVGTLFVHHVVIFKKTLTNTEVIFLDTLLGVTDSIGHHAAFDTLAFLKTEGIEHLHDAVSGE